MTFTQWGDIISGGTLLFSKNIKYILNICVAKGFKQNKPKVKGAWCLKVQIMLTQNELCLFWWIKLTVPLLALVASSVVALVNETITLLAARTQNSFDLKQT